MTSENIEVVTNQLKETPLVKKTKIVLDEIWDTRNKKNGNKYGDEFKYLFGLRLFQYAQGKRYDYITPVLPNDQNERTNILNAYRKRNISSKPRQFQSSLAKQFDRLSLGYNALTYDFTPMRCNLSSEEANKNPNNTAKDHIIGATLCAQYVKYIFQEGKEGKDMIWANKDSHGANFDDWLAGRIDYMCNVWLKDHLWLWAQCRLTKKEHNQSSGVQRICGDDPLREILYKANLEHYKKAEVVLSNYKK